jgi:aminopeptidase YwaD
MTRRRLLVLLIVIAMILTFATPGLANKGNGPAKQALSAFDQRVVRNLDVDRAFEHIRYMSKDIGTRPGGLENEKLAAAYIADYFEALGLETWVQEFGVADQRIGNITVHGADSWFGQGEWGFNEWHGNVWETGAGWGVFTGDDEKISGYVVDCGLGDEGDFPLEVEGKIALVRRGLPFVDFVERATKAGAIGLMIYSVEGGRGNYGSAFSPNVTADIPVLGLALAQGMWFKEMVADGPVHIEIQTWHYSNLTSQNVIATKPAKVPDAPIVVVGGHYDSVVGAPGANDNLSGTAVVMELARVLKDFNTDNYEIRFAAWGSEERGLLGARHYVNTLSPEDLERHIAKYNLDMVATSEYERAPYLFLETVDGLPNVVTETSLAAAGRLGYDEVRRSRFGSSDHVPFHNAGIPAAMFIWLGGAGIPEDYTIERFYHTPQDTIEENVCMYRLKLALEVAGAAVHDLVRKPVPALQNAAIRGGKK